MSDELPGLWSALVDAVPDLVIEPNRIATDSMQPGQRAWLITQFALNTHRFNILRQLDHIIETQLDNGEQPWLPLNAAHIRDYQSKFRSEWEAAAKEITARIADVGVLNKNNRLLALLRLAEDTEARMWVEDDKLARKYLVAEYRGILKQIAEEKGEIGQDDEHGADAFAELAGVLAERLKIAGTRPIEKSIEIKVLNEPGERESLGVRRRNKETSTQA